MEIEKLTGTPAFLTLGAWEFDGKWFEIAGRNKLDSRHLLPWFAHDGQIIAGVLERERPSRLLRDAPLLGLEAIGFDFSGVDQAGDIRAYGRALFADRAHLAPDDTKLQIPLPSWARSIGYLTELALPLLLEIQPPPARELPVAWDGHSHRILFRPVRDILSELARGIPAGEELGALLHALAPPPPSPLPATGPADFTPRAADVWTADRLAISLAATVAPTTAARRIGDPLPADLRFLSAWRVPHGAQWFELVTPASGVTVSLLPYVRAPDATYVLLWNELRPAALERRARRPLFDLPVPVRYANATGFFVTADEQALLARDDRALVERLVDRVVPGARVRGTVQLGPPGEPDNSLSSELRHRYACELDGPSLPALPDGAFLIELGELARAVGDGLVRDPVVVAGLLSLGVDPYPRIRRGDPIARRAYLDHLTEGSQVQARLKTYSSIEAEQLEAPTYARVMTLLQHEFGLRIVYPKIDKDRSFFKAAYRVFMASDRGEDRALQGLHFSHDCFHFVLGNYTPPAMADFARWYASGEPPPAELPPEGPAWEAYASALKHAEDEATFFSFWTLYDEHLPLARHVGKLTFFEAMRDLGFDDRATIWPLYLAIVDDARIPDELAGHPLYSSRKDIRDLMEYMRGFRDYQLGDIRTAWKYAVKEPYRSYAIRFGIYESDLARYLDHVTTFVARLASVPPGLNPLLAACADVKVELALRVWDVMKGLRLAREAAATPAARAQLLALADATMVALEACKADLAAVRATVHDAELSARNEDIHAAIAALAARVAAARAAWWDAIAATGFVAAAAIADERVRDLPR